MKPKEIFGLVVRSVALWEVVRGIATAPGLLAGGWGGFVSFLAAGLEMFVGLSMFYYADMIVDAAYTPRIWENRSSD